MTTALYETDFHEWALHQADLLRSEDYGDLDLDNLSDLFRSSGVLACAGGKRQTSREPAAQCRWLS